jgi:hypothetical protein
VAGPRSFEYFVLKPGSSLKTWVFILLSLENPFLWAGIKLPLLFNILILRCVLRFCGRMHFQDKSSLFLCYFEQRFIYSANRVHNLLLQIRLLSADDCGYSMVAIQLDEKVVDVKKVVDV